MKSIHQKLHSLLFVLLIFGQSYSMEKDQFFEKSDAFFNKYVEDGLVRYGLLSQDKGDLDTLIAYVERTDIHSYSSPEKLAFYINSYNLIVIRNILEKYPVASPMKIGGFFDQRKNKIAGELLTLNDLENKKIRTHNDPRIHFVLVCAAMGCPKLGDFSYTPQKLEQQLTRQTKKALDDPGFLKVDGNRVKLSEIFKWYREDFGRSDKELISFVNKYKQKPLPENAKLNYYTYDWTINEYK